LRIASAILRLSHSSSLRANKLKTGESHIRRFISSANLIMLSLSNLVRQQSLRLGGLLPALSSQHQPSGLPEGCGEERAEEKEKRY